MKPYILSYTRGSRIKLRPTKRQVTAPKLSSSMLTPNWPQSLGDWVKDKVNARLGTDLEELAGCTSSLAAVELSYVVNASVAALNWYPTLTCGAWKLGLAQRPQPGNILEWRAEPGDGLRCCVSPTRPSLTSEPSASSPQLLKVLRRVRQAILQTAQANCGRSSTEKQSVIHGGVRQPPGMAKRPYIGRALLAS
ncbi:unnamed protein product [Schistocephalus solidus]|uniref:Uncharacterized protein n=1 Tax=Schistocephalus solidus TaxID=70667 RepID=A0A183SR93_SCHSO|nr:unnamed protein product [Schistocephalus solidus]